MEAWERHYAKVVSDTWFVGGDDDEPDEDELYLRREKKLQMQKSGYHQCPRCAVMKKFKAHDLHCKDCGWDASTDAKWNDDKCAA